MPAFLLAYFLIGEARMGKAEIYPFGSWAMFSTVPNEITTYRLRLRRIGPRVLDPPVYYGKSEGVLDAPVRISSVMTIRNFGKALRDHDLKTSERLRGLVERTLLPEGTEYEIVEQRYWPIEKWRDNRFEESVIGNFRSNNEGP